MHKRQDLVRIRTTTGKPTALERATIPEFTRIRLLPREDIAIKFTIANNRKCSPDTYKKTFRNVAFQFCKEVLGIGRMKLEYVIVVENHNDRSINGEEPWYHAHGFILVRCMEEELAKVGGVDRLCAAITRLWKQKHWADCMIEPYSLSERYDGCTWEEYICKVNWAQNGEAYTEFSPPLIRRIKHIPHVQPPAPELLLIVNPRRVMGPEAIPQRYVNEIRWGQWLRSNVTLPSWWTTPVAQPEVKKPP